VGVSSDDGIGIEDAILVVENDASQILEVNLMDNT
jgi:hypothetical protein